MIRFGVIGTNWITKQFVDAAHESDVMTLTAVYSRKAETAAEFAEQYGVNSTFTSLEEMAQSDLIDAVYIASPNSLHGSQSILFLSNKKHVICEKPATSNLKEIDAVIDCARSNGVVYFEAFKTAYLPNFKLLQNEMAQIGPVRKVLFNYCQYSSRYQRYLNGENPNTFNPAFSNGSIMDIGFYCVASVVALFGEPKKVTATASLLDSGVDAQGSVIMSYEGFDALVMHSKVSDSRLESEIQGENGTFVITKLTNTKAIHLYLRAGIDGIFEDLTLEQHENTMRYEAEAFVELIEKGRVEHPGLARARITAKVLTEIRRQTGVVFPADR
jgi:predicted dehydrogenase